MTESQWLDRTSLPEAKPSGIRCETLKSDLEETNQWVNNAFDELTNARGELDATQHASERQTEKDVVDDKVAQATSNETTRCRQPITDDTRNDVETKKTGMGLKACQVSNASSQNQAIMEHKRKYPPVRNPQHAKKLKLSRKGEIRPGKGALWQSASGNTVTDYPAPRGRPIPNSTVTETPEYQLTRINTRAACNPAANCVNFSIDEINLRRAYDYCGADKHIEVKDGKYLLHGMRSPLHNYQLEAVCWMLQRERSKSLPHGGILADDMGTGKTITTLALIWKHQPPHKAENKVTLILVQNASIMAHWMDQIKKHCPRLRAQHFTRNNRLYVYNFSSFQILITTYVEVERSWGEIKDTVGNSQNEGEDTEPLDNAHLLFHTTFHRLVLDECHLIKNHCSLTAKAVFKLKAKYTWCVSATPAPNRTDEYFPYLKVLKVDNTENIKQFHQIWYRGGKKAHEIPDQPLYDLLKKIQTRRTTQTKVSGETLFSNVPQRSCLKDSTTLSQEERILYDMVVEVLRKELGEKREQLKTDKTRAKSQQIETSKSDQSHFLTKILQLHKLTAHPYMMESILLGHRFSLKQTQEMRTKFKTLCSKRESSLFAQLAKVCDQAQDRSDVSTESPEYRKNSSVSAASQSVGEVHNYNMEAQLNLVLAHWARSRRCVRCKEDDPIPTQAILTNCEHIYCKNHWKKHYDVHKEKSETDEVKCWDCEKVVHHIEEINQDDLVRAYYEKNAAEKPGKSSFRTGAKSKIQQRQRRRGDDVNHFQPQGARKRSLFLEQSDRIHPAVPMTQSAKTIAIKETILRWQHEAPDDKIIIFTQWILMGRIIGRLLEDNGVPFLYYFGEMGEIEKTKNLNDFKARRGVKVLISGLKCGGTGLDLHCANRVILVDPYWNEQGEEQAFGRVYRKVQEKETFLVRLIAEDSIDSRMAEIKELKNIITSRFTEEGLPYIMEPKTEIEIAEFVLNGSSGQDNMHYSSST